MLDLAGKPMLMRVIERVKQAKSIRQVMVATTNGPDEDPIAQLCAQANIACYRGSLQNVLDRYYQASLQSNADVVVRITADCPLVDPGLIDETVYALFGKQTGNAVWKPQGNPADYPPPTVAGIPWDYASTRLPPPWKRTFPIGLDVEVCTFAALKRAWREAKAQYETEHVLPYLYDEPNRFRCIVADWTRDLGDYRWTVDTTEDLEAMRIIYERLLQKDSFNWLDVLERYEQDPSLASINAGIHHKDFREVDTRK